MEIEIIEFFLNLISLCIAIIPCIEDQISSNYYRKINLIFFSIFIIEILFKILCFGIKSFFNIKFNVIDILVLVSFAIEIIMFEKQENFYFEIKFIISVKAFRILR